MKYFQVLLGLSLVALSAQANVLQAGEYLYRCDDLASDMEALVTVDANGKYVIYDDPGNNCNGRGDIRAHSSFRVFETDCEWKDGFVNLNIESRMIEGERNGEMFAQADQFNRAIKLYFCKRIQ